METIDILVNNVGLFQYGPSLDFETQRLERLSQLHLTFLGMFTTVHTINPVRVTIFHLGITCINVKRINLY